ncbi:hypothetical protein EWM64_g5150 [Hericium alpestre]|uniref:DUF6534 domain-containing protein n=1 Tax=Hericium alpestre TaxID=135208 RepID=A0A4Y9ZZC3_9AGAM|nr:hypothetical protein EWM64_g5150 [Hericium alpestre]
MFVTNFGNHSAPNQVYWSQGALIQAGVIVIFRHDRWETFRAQTISKVLAWHALSEPMLTHSDYDLRRSQQRVRRGPAHHSALFYYLRQRRNAQHRSFDNALSSLTFYVVSTGFSTAVLSVSTLITFMLMPHGGVFLGLASIQSKAYANAFLTNLNARQTIRNRMLRSTGGAPFSEDDAVSAEFTSVFLSGIKTTTRHRGTTAFGAELSPT